MGLTKEKDREARDQGHTYGGSPFRLWKTRTRTRRSRRRERSRGRILTSPFPRIPRRRRFISNILVARKELTDPSTPELVALGFREVGMLNQKCIAIPRDGPREQFIVGLIEHLAGGALDLAGKFVARRGGTVYQYAIRGTTWEAG